jgi:hypothetical protein
MCGRSQIVSNPPADKAGGRLHGNHRRIDLRQELANLPTNEICRSAKDAMIPRLVEVARNPRRYTSHEIHNVILDAAALTEVMVWPGGFGKEPGPGCEPGVADGPLPWRRR